MFHHRSRTWHTTQDTADIALVADQARRAALARGDYVKAREYRIELAIILALREATDEEIRSGEYFRDF